MRIAVLGAGVAGLVAAHRLSEQGHQCDVYERWPGLGGQAATLDIGGGHLLERYYHHLFTSDTHIRELYDELGMPDELEWRESKMAFFAQGRQWPFSTPMDLIRFGPLPPLSRLRMGLAVLYLQKRHQHVEPFEQMTAREWVVKAMGKHAWNHVWGPLLKGKFGNRADDISMGWLWSKLTLRRQLEGDEAKQELLGYPRTSWEPLFDKLVASIESRGGRVLIDKPAQRVAREARGFVVVPGAPDSFRRGHNPVAFDAGEPDGVYDGVISTLPSDVFDQVLDPALAEELGDAYLGKVRSIEYHTALCLLLEIDRQFSEHYWINIADDSVPFVGLIEHTNFIEPERYDGRRFLYVANYLEPGDELLSLSPEELIQRYLPALQRVNPAFDLDWIQQRWMFRESAAQPIVTPGYREKIPPLITPVPGLVMANTTQIYPEDRGTNYSVRLGGDAATALLESADRAMDPPRFHKTGVRYRTAPRTTA